MDYHITNKRTDNSSTPFLHQLTIHDCYLLLFQMNVSEKINKIYWIQYVAALRLSKRAEWMEWLYGGERSIIGMRLSNQVLFEFILSQNSVKDFMLVIISVYNNIRCSCRIQPKTWWFNSFILFKNTLVFNSQIPNCI